MRENIEKYLPSGPEKDMLIAQLKADVTPVLKEHIERNIGAADKLAKSGKLIDALEDLAKYAKDLAAPGREKARKALCDFLDDIYLPKSLTSNGLDLPIPKHVDEHALFMKGDKGLPQGVKPSEKVTLSEKLTSDGYLVKHIQPPIELLKAAELQGIDRTIVQEKLEKAANAFHKAYLEIGDYSPKIHGTERQYGSAFHELLRKNIGNDELLHPELSFRGGLLAKWGQLGTSRVDIGIGAKHEPFGSVCFKILGAIPSAQQERGWAKNLPKLKDGAVPPRLYLKLPIERDK